MKPLQFLLSTSLLLIFAVQVIAQEQEINPLQIDTKLLEHYIKLHTDSFRVAKGLGAQSYDKTLYLAATDHAHYLQKTKSLSHYQNENKDKRKPEDRVNFYKGQFSYLSENLSKSFLISFFENEKLIGSNFERVLWSYQRTAQFIFEGWYNSPEHYLNLINEHSTHTAIAVQIDSTDGSLYTVQLFSKSDQEPLADTSVFPYQSLKLGTVGYDFIPSQKVNARIKKYGPYARKVKINRGTISTNFKNARKLFKLLKRNSGIVFESQGNQDYHVNLISALGGKTRANGLDYYNNSIGFSMTRKALFTAAKASLDKKDYVKLLWVRLPIIKGKASFKVPVPSQGFSDLLFTDGQYPYFHSLPVGVPGDDFRLDFISFDFSPQTHEGLAPKINTCRSHYLYKLYFRPNETISDRFDQTYAEVKEILSNPKNVLDTVFLNATASIEGYAEDNKNLFYKRARSIYDSLPKAYSGKKPILKVRTNENWQMMAKQLKDSPYEFLLEKEKDSVRSFMTTNRFKPPFQSWLDEQRFASLQLTVTTYDTIPYDLAEIASLYNDATKDYLNNTKSKVDKDSLFKLQSAYFKYHEERTNRKIEMMRIGVEKKLIPLRFREVKYLLSRGMIDEKAAFKECSEMAASMKRGELSLLKVLHQQLMVNLSLLNLSSKDQVEDLSFLDEFYKLYHKPKAYKRWKDANSEYQFQETLNRYYRNLIMQKKKELFPAALRHYWGDYYLRELEKENRNQLIVTPKHMRYVANFKRSYVDKLYPLSTQKALALGLFFNKYYRYDWALDMLETVPADNLYGPTAAKVSTAIYLTDDKNNAAEMLINLYLKIGAKEWCEFMQNSSYYNYRKHLNYQTRKLYCEVCQ